MLHAMCGVLTVLWIGWCLYWPFVARAQDIRQANREAAAAYSVCLNRHAVTAAACKADREAFAQLLREAVSPPDQNPYQRFAGRHLPDAIRFMAILCLVPPLLFYAILRAVLEIGLRVIRPRPPSLNSWLASR